MSDDLLRECADVLDGLLDGEIVGGVMFTRAAALRAKIAALPPKMPSCPWCGEKTNFVLNRHGYKVMCVDESCGCWGTMAQAVAAYVKRMT